MDDKVLLTQAGLDELKEELNKRKTETRKTIADDIDRARQQGDLSENAAYKAALEAKEFNENRISQLEDMINNSSVQSKATGGKADLGSNVEVVNSKTSSKQKFMLVGDNEANPAEGKISISSPIGAAIKGKKAGDKTKVTLPMGDVEYTIKSVD